MSARRLFSQLLAEHRPPTRGRCIYCGNPTNGAVCRSHSDLLANEPFLCNQTTTEPADEDHHSQHVGGLRRSEH